MSETEVVEVEGEVQTGWFFDMPMDEYLAIPALSSSGLERFRRSPAHYRYERDHPKPATDAMKLGTALHSALLEPDLFAAQYVTVGQCEGVKKDGERCGYGGSVYRDGSSYCGRHDPGKGAPMAEGVEVVSEDALARVQGMRDAVLSHPEARQFFRGRGASEVTGIWRDEETGVLCKIRLDRQIDRAAIHADVKTCKDASTEGFTRQAGRMGYGRKAAFYRRGMEALRTPAIASVLIAVESQPPHGCQAFLLDEDQLNRLGRDIDSDLSRYAECLRTGEWPGYATGLRALELKPWDMPGDDNNDTDDEWGSDD